MFAALTQGHSSKESGGWVAPFGTAGRMALGVVMAIAGAVPAASGRFSARRAMPALAVEPSAALGADDADLVRLAKRWPAPAADAADATMAAAKRYDVLRLC